MKMNIIFSYQEFKEIHTTTDKVIELVTLVIAVKILQWILS